LTGGTAKLQFYQVSSWKPKSISIIESASNGFLGNNHAAYLQKSNESMYKYSYQDNPSSGLLANALDGSPLTYFEYEAISIPASEILSRGAKEYEFFYSYEETSGISRTIKYKPWSNHSVEQPLKLALSMKSDRPSRANTLEIVPFWGTDQEPAAQIKITKVVAIDDQSKEVNLINEPIYLGTSITPTTTESASNYFYDRVKLTFADVTTSEIRIYMEKRDSFSVNVKHMYWKPLPSSGRFSALNTQTRFDPSALSSLGFGEIQYNIAELVPAATKPNQYKDQSDLAVKSINVTYKDQEKSDVYLISFQRQSGSSLVKNYYTNSFTGFESLQLQQEKAASTNIDFAWKAESKEAANRIKNFIEEKITEEQWSQSNFQNINVETTKNTFNPKTYTGLINLKKEYEIYPAKRWAIGLRSIDVGYQAYESSASFVSSTYEFPHNVKNLTISVDSKLTQPIINQSEILTKFYISLDEAKNWIRISPIENPFSAIPEVLSFNEFVQAGKRLKGVGYYNQPEIPSETKRIKVKVEMFKSKYGNISPVIYSYKLMGRVEQA